MRKLSEVAKDKKRKEQENQRVKYLTLPQQVIGKVTAKPCWGCWKIITLEGTNH